MTDTKQQLDAMIVYILGLIWETGQKLRTTTPKDASIYADTIKTLAQSINQLQWVAYEERAAAKLDADAQPDAPQAEPAEWDEEQTAPEPEQEPIEDVGA
ncbi:MAG: hypothetical protein KAX65_00120 [Caldilineaceae bacterium]|nr:hypothetical protein [Caldilineaceae bacterium]